MNRSMNALLASDLAAAAERARKQSAPTSVCLFFTQRHNKSAAAASSSCREPLCLLAREHLLPARGFPILQPDLHLLAASSERTSPSAEFALTTPVRAPKHNLETDDPIEKRLVTEVFEFAKSIAELQLTESELALYSALVLLQPDRADLRQVSHVRRLNLFIARSLRAELNKSHASQTNSANNNSSAVYELLMSKVDQLKELSSLHMSALTRFRRLSPEIEFPALHRELFSTDTGD